MRYKLKYKKNCQISGEVILSKEEFLNYLKRATKELGKEIEINGFRKGKAPLEILEKIIDPAKVLSKASQLAVRESYFKLIKENNLEPISLPKVEIKKISKGDEFFYHFKVIILPKINLPDYRKISFSVKKRKISVSEREIKELLEQLRKMRAKFISLERETKFGDFIEIDYKLKKEGDKEIKKFSDKFILGKGAYVKGFERELCGLKENERKNFSINFPKDYPLKEYAGKKVHFSVLVKKIRKIVLPELNDEFAKQLGKFKNLAHLKEKLKENLIQEKEIAEREERKNEILEKIASKCDFEIPEILTKAEKIKLKREIKLKRAFPLAGSKKEEKELEKNLYQMARKRVKNFLILREIGKMEKIEVSEKETEERINRFLKIHPQKDLDLEKLKEYYKSVIFIEKVLETLLRFSENASSSNHY